MPASFRADLSRAGSEDDAIDGVVPARVMTPETAQELAIALADLSRAGQRTVVRGGGTKIDWGRVPARVDAVLATARLDRVLTHRHGDLIAVVEAGARLDAVNDELARRGQWLPIESACAGATIGGALATNDSGPLRHRYGTPRDQLIGITLAMTDGRIARAGGEVVKNVAGYDLGKLMAGSHGTLAVILAATFKLAPLPAASKTVAVDGASLSAAVQGLEALRDRPVEPLAVDVHAGERGVGLLVRVASTATAVDAQTTEICRALDGLPARVVEGDEEQVVWRDHVARAWVGDAIVRAAWLPARFASAVEAVHRAAARAGATMTLTGRAGVGAGVVAIRGGLDVQVEAIEALRASAPALEHVVVLRAPPAVKARTDVWGDAGSTSGVLSALKHTLDPAGTLNAGRGPI